jgi:hypothetical protein
MLGINTATALAQQAQQEGVSAETMANANNPLADMNALNFQNYYSPSLYGVPDATSNVLNLRGIMVAGRHIVRATLPVSTVPTGSYSNVSGFGDLNIFDAIVVNPSNAKTLVGVGPLLVLPTHTDEALGAPATYQAGVAAVAVRTLGAGSITGGLLTWQTDFAGGSRRIDTNLMTAQVFATFSVGGGWYVRSTPVALFDFENDRYLVPFGLGAGKVIPLSGAVVNAFIEPQATVYHKGAGQPALQVFAGLNLQFPK